MLDYYREREQQGCRVTVEADHIRTEQPGGFVWEDYPDGRRGHGPVRCVITVHVVRDTRRCRPWWKRLIRKTRSHEEPKDK